MALGQDLQERRRMWPEDLRTTLPNVETIWSWSFLYKLISPSLLQRMKDALGERVFAGDGTTWRWFVKNKNKNKTQDTSDANAGTWEPFWRGGTTIW